MKKLVLVMALFMAPILAQANSNIILDSNFNNEYNTYLSNQSVSFMETNVYFEVFLDGSFTFNIPNALGYSYRGQRARTASGSGTNNSSIHYANQRDMSPNYLVLDHSGILHAIGELQIRYFPNGRVKRIGSVNITYAQERLSQIGNMQIQYDNAGLVSFTSGNINSHSFTQGIQSVKGFGNQDNNLRIKRNTKIRYTGNGIN